MLVKVEDVVSFQVKEWSRLSIVASRPLSIDDGAELTVETRGKWFRHQSAGKKSASSQ